jgi:hypothetical protein
MKILDIVRPWGIFIVARKHPLDLGVIDIKYTSGGPDREFEIELG